MRRDALQGLRLSQSRGMVNGSVEPFFKGRDLDDDALADLDIGESAGAHWCTFFALRSGA